MIFWDIVTLIVLKKKEKEKEKRRKEFVKKKDEWKNDAFTFKNPCNHHDKVITITLDRVFSCVNQSFSMFYSTREIERATWAYREAEETADSSMKSEISMEWNRSRSQTDKCICAIDGQILFPPSSLIVNFEIVYPIDSRPSASGSKPGCRAWNIYPGMIDSSSKSRHCLREIPREIPL